MPYSLLKAHNKNLYWVITTATRKKHSYLPMPKEQAERQLTALRIHGY